MKTIVTKEIDKLEKHFNQDDIKDSWYYSALQKIVNGKNELHLPICQSTTKEFNIDKMKHDLIKYTCTLENNNLIEKVLHFIENNFKNPYFFNAIQATISILKKTEENLSLEEAKYITFKDRFDLSGFEISVINNLLPYLYTKENNKNKIYK